MNEYEEMVEIRDSWSSLLRFNIIRAKYAPAPDTYGEFLEAVRVFEVIGRNLRLRAAELRLRAARISQIDIDKHYNNDYNKIEGR